jgi:hypothetical protein
MMYLGGGCECGGLERRGQVGVGVRREVDVCRESEEVVTARWVERKRQGVCWCEKKNNVNYQCCAHFVQGEFRALAAQGLMPDY